MSDSPLISLVIPIYNEVDNIRPLFEAVRQAMQGHRFELVLVDDGSRDGTHAALEEQAKVAGFPVQLLFFQRNYGQTSAMAAGIDAARGDFIATLDGDLQNDPADIPMMLAKLREEKLDVVVGWRKNRKDGMVLRKIPSKIANVLIRNITGVHVHDYGCTLKVFRADLAKQLELYGELHRFIPILSSMYSARIAEVEVRHHPRLRGVSKYGLSRTLRVSSDLLLMFFFLKYRQRPMHLFGTMGLGLLVIGGAMEAYLLMLKIMGESIGQRPLFFIGILLIVTGVQLITAGFVSELLMRTYYSAKGSKPYMIRSHELF